MTTIGLLTLVTAAVALLVSASMARRRLAQQKSIWGLLGLMGTPVVLFGILIALGTHTVPTTCLAIVGLAGIVGVLFGMDSRLSKKGILITASALSVSFVISIIKGIFSSASQTEIDEEETLEAKSLNPEKVLTESALEIEFLSGEDVPIPDSFNKKYSI